MCQKYVCVFLTYTIAVNQINKLNETSELTSLTMRVPIRRATLASYDFVRKVIFGNFLKYLGKIGRYVKRDNERTYGNEKNILGLCRNLFDGWGSGM